MEGDSSGEADPWRKLSARELRANTVTFAALKQVKLLDYVLALENHGVCADSVLSIQISTKGQCRITLSEISVAQMVVSNGFRVGEHHISPEFFGSNNTIQLHIHDAPVWISDYAIEAALAAYGTVQGRVRHGKIRIREGVYVASGVRFVTFKRKSSVSIPSFVTSPDGNHVFRVHHSGQQPTCRICGSLDHFAKACPQANRSSSAPSDTGQHVSKSNQAQPSDGSSPSTHISYARAASTAPRETSTPVQPNAEDQKKAHTRTNSRRTSTSDPPRAPVTDDGVSASASANEPDSSAARTSSSMISPPEPDAPDRDETETRLLQRQRASDRQRPRRLYR